VIDALFAVSPQWSANFLLVLARLSAALVAIPLFGARGVPAPAKIGLAALLSLIVLPLQSAPSASLPTDLLPFASLVGSEVLVGLAIGVAVSLVFSALEMGATLVGVQIGFGLHGVIDPLTGSQSSVLNQFYRMVVTLIFFAVNGHYLVITGLLQTFEVVPTGTADLTLIAGDRVVPFFTSLFVVAIRIALPVMGALMLTDLAMGLVARTVPQMNVLVVGFPVKVGVGLFVLALAMPLTVALMASTFGSALPQVNGFLRP
jgi:flagellar biosynthetic protein FliR